MLYKQISSKKDLKDYQSRCYFIDMGLGDGQKPSDSKQITY